MIITLVFFVISNVCAQEWSVRIQKEEEKPVVERVCSPKTPGYENYLQINFYKNNIWYEYHGYNHGTPRCVFIFYLLTANKNVT